MINSQGSEESSPPECCHGHKVAHIHQHAQHSLIFLTTRSQEPPTTCIPPTGLSPGISPPGFGPSPRVSLLGGQPVRGQGGLSTSRGSLQLSARGSTLQLGRPSHRASVQFEGLSGGLSKVAADCYVSFLCYLVDNIFGLTK